MATEFVNQDEEDLPKTKKNQDNWKYPKIPIDEIYEKKLFGFFRSYAIKDYEKTITLKSSNQNVSVQLLSRDFLKCFIRRYHNYLHLGLVQISVQPLLRHGLGGGSIVVCLRDGRFLKFNSGLLAVVESDLSQAPFYFNCFPSYSVCLSDDVSPVLTLHVKTSGIPLALTYRLVCMATKRIAIGGRGKLKLGETTYFQTSSGNSGTTKWDEVAGFEGL